MKKDYYFKSFELEQKNFNKLFEKYPCELKPSWQHYWFYRFLQISPSYYFEHVCQMTNAERDKLTSIEDKNKYSEKIKRKYENSTLNSLVVARISNHKNWRDFKQSRQKKLNYSPEDFTQRLFEVSKTYTAFGDVWKYGFIRWWYIRGQRLFKNNEFNNDKIFEYYNLPFNNRMYSPDVDIKVENFKKHLNLINEPKLYGAIPKGLPIKFIRKANFFFDKWKNPTYLGLSIPIRNTKKETMKMIGDFLDKKINFGKPEISKGFFSIYKSKMREVRISGAYQMLELRALQEKANLKEIAEQANIIKTSLAGYKTHTDIDKKLGALDSLRSGTSRYINVALMLAENAAVGKFPCMEKPKVFYDFDYIEINNILNILIHRNNSQKFNRDETIRYLENLLKKPKNKKPFNARHR